MKSFLTQVSGFISIIALALAVVSFGMPGNADSQEKQQEKQQEKHQEKAVEPSPTSAALPTGEKTGAAESDKKDEKKVARRTSSCLVDENALDDLKQRKQELQEKSKELANKETEISTRERALNEEIKKLEAVRDEITKLKVAFKKENEEKVNRLIETFQTMSPKAASILMASIDEGLAIAAMSRMETPKLAKIMNIMDPEKSSRLTEAMAGVARGASQNISQNISRKGGDKRYGNENATITNESAAERSPAGQKAGVDTKSSAK